MNFIKSDFIFFVKNVKKPRAVCSYSSHFLTFLSKKYFAKFCIFNWKWYKTKALIIHVLIFLVNIFCCTIFFSSSAHADLDGGIGRLRSCNGEGRPDGLDFNPTSGGKDVQFVMSNPVCISVVAYAYAKTKIEIAAMNSACGTGDVAPRVAPSPILDLVDIGRAGVRAGTTGNSTCAGKVTASIFSLNETIAHLGAIYLIARSVYENSEICGAGWTSPNPAQFLNNAPNQKATVENIIFGRGGYIDNNQLGQLNFNNQVYREWYYGGKEVTDHADGDICYDVAVDKVGGEYQRQKYYMKGLETGNFNCKKYYILPETNIDPRDGNPLTDIRRIEYKMAYDCCKRRAREYVCIKYLGEEKFCHAGDKCVIKGITFQTKSIDNGRLACAETYSLCPYNFTIGGGAEKCDFFQDGIYDSGRDGYQIIDIASVTSGNCAGKSEIRNADCTYNDKAGRCKNYCQFMTHCTKTDLSDYQHMSSISSPYFSSACFNFTGDSQNQIAYGTGFIAGSARHFSAPIAQCAKETIENVFHNRAGHTKCRLLTSTPSNNNCPGGTLYVKGDKVGAKSFFERLQDNLHRIIQLTLTFSVVFFGVKVLLGRGDLGGKKELVMYVIKVGLILFFATGDAWQSMFFDGIYSSSTTFSKMVFKLQTDPNPAKRDGCQFGDISLTDGTQVSQSKYPIGKEYLAIWDTLDCKIARYMGFGPEISAANIGKLILAGFLTGPIGIYFAIALLFFGLTLIAATIRALHIFLSSSIAIVLLVYVSPIIFPLALFEKTKGMIGNWIGSLIGFILQIMILFAYLGIFISLMDKTLIGSATFYGAPPFRTISCKEYCQEIATGTIVDNLNCDSVGQKLVVPKADSIACMIDTSAFGKWPGLELFGISLPFLIDFFKDHTREKILTIAKAALMMYFLFKFMDEVPGITSSLVGGGLPGAKDDINAVGFFKSATGFLSSLQQRGSRGIMKFGGGAGKEAKDALKKILSAGNKGKSVSKIESDKEGDESESSTDKTETESPSGDKDEQSSSKNPDEKG